MEIKTDDYQIWYDSASNTVFWKGILRLEGMKEYQPIMDLMLPIIDQASTLTLNLQSLEFLNSSGISMLSMIVLKIREKGNIQLTLQGSSAILWQTKSLRNLQRLMPSLQLEIA
ncbi:MAG: hypothetical protein VKJ02_04220 [Snowella sp.]|nr:hypothetical protein [Snowella sp.]